MNIGNVDIKSTEFDNSDDQAPTDDNSNVKAKV